MINEDLFNKRGTKFITRKIENRNIYKPIFTYKQPDYSALESSFVAYLMEDDFIGNSNVKTANPSAITTIYTKTFPKPVLAVSPQTVSYSRDKTEATLKPYMTIIPYGLNYEDEVLNDFVPRKLAEGFIDTIKELSFSGDSSVSGGFEGLLSNASAYIQNSTNIGSIVIEDLFALIRKTIELNGNTVWVNGEVLTSLLSGSSSLAQYAKESYLSSGMIEGVFVKELKYIPKTISTSSIVGIGGSPKNYSLTISNLEITEIMEAGSTIKPIQATCLMNGNISFKDSFVHLTIR